MSRPLARRLVPLTVAGACLAATAIPAAAQTVSPDPKSFDVFVSQSPGDRLFDVYDRQGALLQNLDFRTDADGQLPFQTVVTDDVLHLSTPGYYVDAVMSNLYYVNGDGSLDLSTKIDSSDISLGYDRPLSVPALNLPVDPDVALGGVMRACDAAGLGVTVEALTLDPVLSQLCPLLSTLVTTSPNLPSAPAPVADGTTQTITLAELTAASGGVLDYAKLPFGLTGQQQAGSFTNPSRYYVTDTVHDGVDPAAATTKRVMTGTPSLLDTTTGLIDAVLSGKVTGGTLALLPTQSTSSLVPWDELQATLAGIDQNYATIMSLVDDLSVAQQTYLLGGVTGALVGVVEGQLSTISANYVASPVLIANPASTRAGEYKGRLTVTFFQR